MEKDDGGRQKQQPLLAKVGHFKSHFPELTLPQNEGCHWCPLSLMESEAAFRRSTPNAACCRVLCGAMFSVQVNRSRRLFIT